MQRHKRLFTAVAVILMLLGMFFYVISMDEADPPDPDLNGGQNVEQTVDD